MSLAEMKQRGWDELDVLLISGDAYVDHSSYGIAVIARVLEAEGLRVGIISQPDWRDSKSVQQLGRPRLFVGISGGNVDSMIANYTANKKPRSDDDYSPGGREGLRPDRAVLVYCNLVRQAFGDIPIVIGGVEASLRRFSHYDYWDDKVRNSILIDSRADILVYGMGEAAIKEISRRLEQGETVSQLDNIRGTAVVRREVSEYQQAIMLPSAEEVAADTKLFNPPSPATSGDKASARFPLSRDEGKEFRGKNSLSFNKAFVAIYRNMDPLQPVTLIQPHGNRFVVQFPGVEPLKSRELDRIYELPFQRNWHPQYDAIGGVPGFETVRWSLISHRGCCGECSFCSLYFHQGRIVQSRSKESLVREAVALTRQLEFKGTITDVGGPTSNMYAGHCRRWKTKGTCPDRHCLVPSVCAALDPGYDQALELLREMRRVPGVKHVFMGSGFRFDLLIDQKALPYLEEVCTHHVSGLMKVAPEHCSNNVLQLMNKPNFDVYERFVKEFKGIAARMKQKVFIVNYFISSHPGASLQDALKLALYLAKRGVAPEQIQDFIPSPMTAATCMYYTGHDPFTNKPVYVARTSRERKLQRALLQYNKPHNLPLIKEALKELHAEHVLPKLQPNAARPHRTVRQK